MATVRREGAQSATQVNRSMDGVGRKLTQLGFLAKAAFSSAIVVGARQAVREFALLEGAVAKFNVVFGNQSEEMREWVDTVRERVPLATREIVQNTAALQDLLVPMGIARSEAMGMTQDWFELAAALSAFNDVPVEQALQAIQSGIAGQTRPLRQFGIDVRETALQQTALEEGLISSADAMDETARQQALLIQAYNQSQDAIDGYEDQLGSTLMLEQELSAAFRDKTAEIGERLQPAYNELIGVLLRVIEVSSSFSSELEGLRVIFTELPGPIRAVNESLSDYIQALRFIEQNSPIGTLRELGSWFRDSLGAIGNASEFLNTVHSEMQRINEFGFSPDDLIIKDEEVEKAQQLSDILSDIKPKIDAIVDHQIIDPAEEQALRQLREEMDEFENTLHEIATMEDMDFSHRLFPPGSMGAIRQEIENIENQLESATDEERIQRLNDRIRELQEELQRLGGLSGQTKEDLEEMSDAGRLFTRTLADGLQQVLFQARSVSDALDGIIRQLGSRALTAGLATLISGGSIGFSTAFFGGFRASGGAVSQGRGYVVGEQGPELFVPDSGGSIVSNEQMRGSERTLNINITGNLKGDGNDIRAIVQESIRIEGRKR